MLTKSQEPMETNHEEITNEGYVNKGSVYTVGVFLCFCVNYSDITKSNLS